jgi:hypothetical protein
MPNLPDRLLTVGGAVVSNSPSYGQGMSLASVAAGVLQEHLAGADDLDGLSGRVQTKIGSFARRAFNEVAAMVRSSRAPSGAMTTLRRPLRRRLGRGGLDVLATERPKISQAVQVSMYDMRYDDLKTNEIVALCDDRIACGEADPPFDRDRYPTSVEPVGSLARGTVRQLANGPILARLRICRTRRPHPRSL